MHRFSTIFLFLAYFFSIGTEISAQTDTASIHKLLNEAKIRVNQEDNTLSGYNIGMSQEYSRMALEFKKSADYNAAEFVYKIATNDKQIAPAYRYNLKLNWCELLLRRGLYQSAEDFLYEIKQNTSQVDWKWYIRMAETQTYLGTENNSLLDSALAIYNNILDDKFTIPKSLLSSVKCQTHANRGYLFAQRKQFGQAADDMLAALNQMDSNSVDYQIIASNLAIVESFRNNFEKAISLIDAALVWFKQNLSGGENHPDYIIALRKKAEILLRSGQKELSGQFFYDYFERERNAAIAQFPTFNRQQQLDYWSNKHDLISEIFALENSCAEKIFDVSIFRRETAMIGRLNAAEIKKRLSLHSNDIRKKLKNNEIAIDFVRYEKDSIQQYGAIIVPPSTSQQNILFIPLWTDQSINNHKVSSNYTLYDAILKTKKTSPKNYIYTDSLLAQKVWQPILPYIQNSTDIYFCPDGILNLLAIEYLPHKSLNDKNLHRLTSFSQIERTKTTSTQKNFKLLAVGGLNYNQVDTSANDNTQKSHEAVEFARKKLNEYPHFKNLEHSKNEILSVDSSWKASIDTAFIKSEYSLRQDFNSLKYNYLLFSTHGYALKVDIDEKPMFQRDSVSEDRSLLASGIALTGCNAAHKMPYFDDGILSARELCDLNLPNVDLVVLSACQTALGEVSDEGPVGMLRGLKKAGVKTVIASLWEVDDSSTARLMRYFFQNLSDNPTISKTTALRDAQQQLRNFEQYKTITYRRETIVDKTQTERPFKDPYYWAAFIVIDDK